MILLSPSWPFLRTRFHNFYHSFIHSFTFAISPTWYTWHFFSHTDENRIVMSYSFTLMLPLFFNSSNYFHFHPSPVHSSAVTPLPTSKYGLHGVELVFMYRLRFVLLVCIVLKFVKYSVFQFCIIQIVMTLRNWNKIVSWDQLQEYKKDFWQQLRKLLHCWKTEIP